MTRIVLVIFVPVALLVAISSGCGTTIDGPKIVPVSGQVTVDGEPAAHVLVRFKPELIGDGIHAGPSSAAFADEEGRFELMVTVGERPVGAAVGKHRVTILGKESKEAIVEWSPPDPEDVIGTPPPPRPVPKVRFPRKNRPLLTFTVPEDGTNAANFAL